MVEHSPQILASKENATTTTTKKSHRKEGGDASWSKYANITKSFF